MNPLASPFALSNEELFDLACEANGDTAQTVRGLVGGVLARHGHLLDRAAQAALLAVIEYHVPQLQDEVSALVGESEG